MRMESDKNKYLYMLLGFGIFPFFINGLYNPFLSFYPVYYWVAEIVAWVFLPLIVVYLGISKKLFSFEQLGFHMKIAGKKSPSYFIVTVACVSLFLVLLDYFFIGNIVDDLFPNNYFKVNFRYQEVIPEAPMALWFLVVMYMALSAGVVEEFYYRGVMRMMFGDGVLQVVAFVLISSFIFSAVHWEGGVQNLFEAWVFGIAASCIFLWIKNIWPLIVGHTVNDILWFW